MLERYCETLEDVKQLWQDVASVSTKNELKDLEIQLDLLDDVFGIDMNAIGITEGTLQNQELQLTVYFDEVFIDLKPEWQVAVVCHEMAHAAVILEMFHKLQSKEIDAAFWNKYSKTSGHDEYWENVLREICTKVNADFEKAKITKIDFTDNKYFQTQL